MTALKEERTKKYLQYLDDEYATKDNKWWKPAADTYVTTANFASRRFVAQNSEIPTIISFDRKRHLRELAAVMTFTIGGLLFFTIPQFSFKNLILPLVFILSFFGYQLAKEYRRKPKLILSKQGFWLHTIGDEIPWIDVVATYIKVIPGDGSDTYELNIHYYSPRYDLFYLAELKLASLDISAKILAADIENRRRIAELL